LKPVLKAPACSTTAKVIGENENQNQTDEGEERHSKDGVEWRAIKLFHKKTISYRYFSFPDTHLIVRWLLAI
jgi:hypothetical protein